MDLNHASPTVSNSQGSDASQYLKQLLNVGPGKGGSSVDGVELSASSAALPDSLHGDGSGDASSSLTDLRKTMYTGESSQHQSISLTGRDISNSFAVYGHNVDIIASKASSSFETTPGSNKVKILPVVNYDWELKWYVGNLVAVHRACIYVAYVLRGKNGGIVRLMNRKTAERALLKDFTGRVIDLAFAHTDGVLLGVIDEIGNLFTYEITETQDKKIKLTLLLHIVRPEGASRSSDFHRLIWCPFIPDDGDDDDTDGSVEDNSRMLVLTCDEKAEIWNIDQISNECGSGPINPDDVDIGKIIIDSHEQAITDAAFSPDGTALATASLDGYVKFFQIYIHEGAPPRCLHQWKPHNDMPVSSLFFLDDHENIKADTQFWKFVITGANNNQEIKIWSCQSWKCLQTIRFLPSPASSAEVEPVESALQARLDTRAKFLILSDIRRKVLYILHLYQDNEANIALVSSIDEFLVTQPCVSLAIMSVTAKSVKATSNDAHMEEITTGEVERDDEDNDHRGAENSISLDQSSKRVAGVQIKLFTIHTKNLQELQIRFRPNSTAPYLTPPSMDGSTSLDESVLRDGLSDMSIDVMNSDMDTSVSSIHSRDPPLLLTPDAFTASTSRCVAETTQTSGGAGDAARHSVSSSSSFTHVTTVHDDSSSLYMKHTESHQARTSPDSSTITMTPSSTREFSPSASHDLTPSSIPLPPSSPAEQEALKSTPNKTTDTFVPEPSPLSGIPQPQKLITLDDLFAMHTKSTALPSMPTPTSSTSINTSQELSDLLHDSVTDKSEHTKTVSDYEDKQQSQGNDQVYPMQSDASVTETYYDEYDQEVADVLNESKTSSSQHDIDYRETEIVEADDDRKDLAADLNDKTDGQATEGKLIDVEYPEIRPWPKPPDVTVVTSEAQRHAEESHMVNIYEAELDEDDEDDEDDVQILEIEEECITAVDEDHERDEPAVAQIIDIDSPEEQREVIPVHHRSSQSAPDDSTSDTEEFASPARPVRLREEKRTEIQVIKEVVDKEALQELQGGMRQMLDLLVAQQEEMTRLKQNLIQQQQEQIHFQQQLQETQQLHQVAMSASQPDLEEHLGKLEDVMGSRVERLLSQHSHKEGQRLEEIVNRHHAQEKKRHEQVLAMVSGVTEAIPGKLERFVKHEIKSSVVPAMTKILDPLKEQLHHDLAQKLTATDALLKDNIGKIIRSRQTLDTIGQATAQAVQIPIQTSYREAFQNIVIPSFESATQMMYHQVNDAFSKGTKEYTSQLESHLEQVRQQQVDARDPLIHQLQALVDSFQTSADRIQAQVVTALLGEVHEQLRVSLNSMSDTFLERLRDVVKDEVTLVMQEQNTTISDTVMNAVRSHAATPVPMPPDPEQQKYQIMQLAKQGNVNGAFQQALSASNLDTVMYLCETVNVTDIFSQAPCPLHQPVLLSLIQQLSAELNNRTETKHRYLEEAIMNLDPSHPVTQEHMKGVLYGLCQKLKTHIQAYPAERMTKPLKMLLMASQSLLNQ